MPLGRRLGLITGYVQPQAGSSKRTAAGNAEIQKRWYDVVTDLFDMVKQHAMDVLQDEKLVKAMLPYLNANLDEECLQALGKNSKIVGAAGKIKHDNQNASSRFILFVLVWPHFSAPCGCFLIFNV